MFCLLRPCALALALAAALPTRPAEKTPAASPQSAQAKIDLRSSALLARLSALYRQTTNAEVELHLTAKMADVPVPPEDLDARYLLSIARPNQFALVLRDGALGATAISDGTNLTTFLPKLKLFTVQPAPHDLSGLESDSGSASRDTLGSLAFISALFSPSPRDALLAGVLDASYGGPENIGGQECERINFKQEGLLWSLFVLPGDQPLARRIDVKIPQLQMSLDFTHWKLNATFPPDRFKFVPPLDAKKVESFGDASDPDDEGQDSSWVGEIIPAFKLKNLDGTEFDTASLRGSPSILVVWGGEAEHCVNALRAATELAAATPGARLQSINIDEKPDPRRVRALLAKERLALPVALDQKQTAVEALELDGVPITFLIDGGGVVRAAFLGYHPEFKALVGKHLAALAKPGPKPSPAP